MPLPNGDADILVDSTGRLTPKFSCALGINLECEFLIRVQDSILWFTRSLAMPTLLDSRCQVLGGAARMTKSRRGDRRVQQGRLNDDGYNAGLRFAPTCVTEGESDSWQGASRE